MSSLVIAAIPAQDETVWDVSSEKVPHMTLLYMGEVDQVDDVQAIVDFVEHACKTMAPFWMEVDYRGELGPDKADVVFFEKGWEFKTVERFRNQLLQNGSIKKAFNSVEQYPEWLPHLTLGYPATPAKEEKDGRKVWHVLFDRIGVWMGDYEGPEFRLKHEDMSADLSPSVSMSAAEAKELLHYGVKGQKWGVRKSHDMSVDHAPKPTRGGIKGRVAAAKAKNDQARADAVAPKPVAVKTGLSPKGKAVVKTEGGKNQPAHPDAIKAATTKQQLHNSGLNSLSNKELQALATRLNLEQQVNRLEPQKMTLGQKFAKRAMNDPIKTQKEVDAAIKQGSALMKLAKGAKTATKVAAVVAA